MTPYYLLAAAFFFVACTAGCKSQENMQANFDIEGHRGCRGLMPENTIPAMKKAIDLGVTTLEMDVVITRDKRVVVSHDLFFNHEITTKPGGGFIDQAEEKNYRIFGMTYEEVRAFDVGMKPHPKFPRQQKMKAYKPLLSELLDSVQQYTSQLNRSLPYFNIETKSSPAGDNLYHPEPPEFVELLMAVIRQKRLEERVIIQSFDFRTLQYLHEHYPAIQTAMLIDGSDKRGLDEQLKALGFVPTIYSPAHQLVTPSVVEQCHRRHLKLIPWTVDTRERINELKEMGVDGIISDYPDLFN